MITLMRLSSRPSTCTFKRDAAEAPDSTLEAKWGESASKLAADALRAAAAKQEHHRLARPAAQNCGGTPARPWPERLQATTRQEQAELHENARVLWRASSGTNSSTELSAGGSCDEKCRAKRLPGSATVAREGLARGWLPSPFPGVGFSFLGLLFGLPLVVVLVGSARPGGAWNHLKDRAHWSTAGRRAQSKQSASGMVRPG